MTRFIRLSHIIVLALSTFPIVAQEAPSSAPVPDLTQLVQPGKPPVAPPHNGRITGTVLCADTHRPARGAVIMIVPIPALDGKGENNAGSQGFARVASDGTYVVEHMVAGEYGVMALLPGYLSPIDEVTAGDINDNSPQKIRDLFSKYGTVTVRGQETGSLDLSLQRGAAVSGRILYADGSPASQIMIDVQDVNAKSSKSKSPGSDINPGALMRSMFMRQNQGTDDQGHFRIAGLPPGTYRVAAVQASANPMDAMSGGDGMAGLLGFSSSPTDLHIYSGDTLHKKSAKTYELRFGDEVSGVDITVPVDAFHRVTGRLSTADGRSINAATLTLTDTVDDSLTFQSNVDHEGVFVIPAVPAGTYTLAATQAKIGAMPDGYPDNMPINAGMLKVTNVFADGKTSVIVKESDVADVNLTLTEVPLPPDANKPEISVPITPPPQP
jgi:hypothetical protein